MTAFGLGDMPALTAGFRPYAGDPDTGPGNGQRPGPSIDSPPTLDDLGLTDDRVAQVVYLRGLAAEIELAMTDDERADLAQYEQPRHLRSVA